MMVEKEKNKQDIYNEVISARETFQDELIKFGGNYKELLNKLENEFENFIASNPTAKQSETWNGIIKPKFSELNNQVHNFLDKTPKRPSACVMGKRGQGKTSLLINWLGETSNHHGIEEMQYLPIGQQDTTACLIRLTKSNKENKDLDSSFLKIDMISAEDLKRAKVGDIDKPPHPKELKSAIISRLPSDGCFKETPLSVCRYSDETRDNGYYVNSFESVDDSAVKWNISKENSASSIKLESIQMWGKEALVPCDLKGEGNSYADNLLSVMDIIDAPGAEVPEQGSYREWKGLKNGLVFRTMINSLDILLIVGRCHSGAITIGPQMQNEIWKPWVSRCGNFREGRSIFCFNEASTMFNEMEASINKKEQYSPAALIYKGLIEPLIDTDCGDLKNLLEAGCLDTWPPVLFFENKEESLQKYREGIEKGSAKKNAKLLIEKLHGGESSEGLPLGLECIMAIVRDWKHYQSAFGSEENLKLFQEWLIKSLCALLDPLDGGHRLLTSLLTDMTTLGAISYSHAEERLEHMKELQTSVDSFLIEMQKQEHNPKDFQTLLSCSAYFKQYWLDNPCGPVVQSGEQTSIRLKECIENENKTGSKSKFSFNDVCNAVVHDTLTQMSFEDQKPEGVEVILSKLLMHDSFIQDLVQYCDQIHKQSSTFRQATPIILERLVRVLQFLAKAEHKELVSFCKDFYGLDPEIAELMECFLKHEKDTGLFSTNAEGHITSIQASFDQLIDTLRKHSLKSPYRESLDNTFSESSIVKAIRSENLTKEETIVDANLNNSAPTTV